VSRAGARAVLWVGAGIYATSGLGLLLMGHAGIRYSADHGETRPLWHVWLPALAGIAFIRASSPRPSAPIGSSEGAEHRRLVLRARICVAAALLFAAGLFALPPAWLQEGFVALKLLLLVAVPVVAFRMLGRNRPLASDAGTRSMLGPLLPTAVWFALAYFGPMAKPAVPTGIDDRASLAAVLILGFVVNAGIEEVFYRIWLQTSLERLLGRWPGIVIASLLWASWHASIQGTGSFLLDVATTISNQGVLGLYLGYLWSAYRRAWAPLAVHAAVNAPLAMLAALV
jgi:uncharacterized protein